MSEDLVDLRSDRKSLSNLVEQKRNAEIWARMNGHGNVAVISTTDEAIRLVRERFKGAKVLVTESRFLAGCVLRDPQNRRRISLGRSPSFSVEVIVRTRTRTN